MKKKSGIILTTVICLSFIIVMAIIAMDLQSTAKVQGTENQASALQTQQAKNRTTITMKSAIPITKIDKSTVASNFGFNVNDLVENYYQDSDKNVYMIDDQNRLTTYWESDSSHPEKLYSSITQSDAEQILRDSLNENLPYSKDFKINTCHDDGENYNIQMERVAGKDIADCISATIHKNGDISSISIHYCNVDDAHPITDQQKALLDAQAQEYIEGRRKDNTDAKFAQIDIKNKSYYRSENKIKGTYTFLFTYNLSSGPTSLGSGPTVYDADAQEFFIDE